MFFFLGADSRGRDTSSDNYHSRGTINNNFYANNNGPRNAATAAAGNSSGGFPKPHAGRGNNTNDRRPPPPTTQSTTLPSAASVVTDDGYALGEYGWADCNDDAPSSTITSAPAVADKGKGSTLADPNGGGGGGAPATIRGGDARPSIDRDSNSSAEGANVRRRRRNKVNSNYSQACKYGMFRD